jgi:DNA-binding MarR family transcriptional regulator
VGKQSSVADHQPAVSAYSSAGRQSTVAAGRSTAASRQASARRQMPAGKAPAPARSAQPRALNLDRLIHERLRLGIVSALAVNECLSFTDLKRLLDTTDGNLSVHARKLEEAEYIACDKSFDGRVPRTEYRLTAAGRRALEKYLVHMEALIRAVRE